jgi:DNA-binding Xre family transcriptional regulator
MKKPERIEIYPTNNNKYVIRTDVGQTVAFDTLDEVCRWLKDMFESKK